MQKIQFKHFHFILGVLAVILFHFYLEEDTKKTKMSEEKEYPSLSNLSQRGNDYRGMIVKRVISSVYKGAYLYELSNGQKFTTSSYTFLQVGDSIHIPSNMDSIFIFSKNEIFRSFLFRESK